MNDPSAAGHCEGPSGVAAIRWWIRFLRDPLATLIDIHRSYGDMVRWPLSRNHTIYLLSRPEHAEHVLVRHQDRYKKPFTYEPFKAVLGNGLLTSEGETWRRHRSIVQPSFSHRNIQSFATEIVRVCQQRADGWQPGSTIDIGVEMRHITVSALGRLLFGADLTGDTRSVAAALDKQEAGALSAVALAAVPSEWMVVVTKLIPNLGEMLNDLNSVVRRIIDSRVAELPNNNNNSDLLGRLLTSNHMGQILTRHEVEDEVITLLIAGNDTTANTLTWALALLSRHPSARERLCAEVRCVLGGRAATSADLEHLPWARAVISEAMRLYPPAWDLERDALVDDDIDGVRITSGSTVAISPYLLHRNPEFWPNPEGFNPERFMPDYSVPRHRYSFLPFGAGRRICVGASFAMLEASLVLCTLAQRVRLDLVPGTVLAPRADITLRPQNRVRATVYKKEATV